MARGLAKGETYLSILRYLHDNPDRNTKPELQKAFGFSPQRLHYYISRLKKEGLIIIHNTYPRTLSLTPKAKKLLLEGKLKTYSGGQSEAPHPTRLHALQVLIPVLREGQKLPLGKEINMKGWSRRYLKEEIPNTTVEILDLKGKKKVRLYIHDIVLPPSTDKFYIATQILMKILFIVNSYFTRKGWILDIFHYEIVNQELETAMPELQKGGKQPKKVRVYLNRDAKGVDDAQIDQKAWVEIGTDSLQKGIPDRETNDRTHEEKWALLPELVHDVVAPNIVALNKSTIPLLKALQEDLRIHIPTYRAMYDAQRKMNQLLEELNKTLKELSEKIK